jgi:hypothetical protein
MQPRQTCFKGGHQHWGCQVLSFQFLGKEGKTSTPSLPGGVPSLSALCSDQSKSTALAAPAQHWSFQSHGPEAGGSLGTVTGSLTCSLHFHKGSRLPTWRPTSALTRTMKPRGPGLGHPPAVGVTMALQPNHTGGLQNLSSPKTFTHDTLPHLGCVGPTTGSHLLQGRERRPGNTE